MKQKSFLLHVIVFSFLLGSIACKKDNTPDKNNSDNEIELHADDEAQFDAEIDAIANDANLVLESGSSFSPRIQDNIICDASIAVNAQANPQTITITYNGTNCLGNRSRSGVVVISAPSGTKWDVAGAAVKVEFRDLKVTRSSDKKSVTISGEQTYTNTSGGLLSELSSLESITHTIASSGLSVTFSNGSKRTWQVAKQRLFTYNDGVVIAVSGKHTEGDKTNIAIWGNNRLGTSFTTSINEPLVIRQNCSFRLTSGTIEHTVGSIVASATFGLDANGSPVSCPSGNYYYKVIWTGPNGNSFTAMRPY